MVSTPKEEWIILALEAIQRNENFTLRAASKICIIHYKILTYAPMRRKTCTTRYSSQLTDLEEQTIARYLIEQCARAFHFRLVHVEDIANQQLRECNAPPIGVR